MSLDTISLQCFIAVAETGNFTTASQKVGRTQSAVSQQVARLEAILDRQLIVRGKICSLTTDGEVFLSYARKIVTLWHETIDRFKEPSLEGEVSFGLPEDFASVFLSSVLVDFKRLHPRISVNIECDLTVNLFNRFRKNEFDLVLVKMNSPDEFSYGTKVWSEKLEWVGNGDLDDVLEPIPLVLSPQPCVYRKRAIAALNGLNTKWRIIFSSPSYAGTVAAVRAGMGITVLPRNMIPDDLSIINEKNYFEPLDNTDISLLKHKKNNPVINSFEKFVLKNLGL